MTIGTIILGVFLGGLLALIVFGCLIAFLCGVFLLGKALAEILISLLF